MRGSLSRADLPAAASVSFPLLAPPTLSVLVSILQWRLQRQRYPIAERKLQPAMLARHVETLFSVLQVIISVVLVLLVLMHSGKDSGLSGAFGVGTGSGPLGGGSMVERNLNRWTIFFGILFLLNAVILLKRPWA
jgi:preprotein translocase subunit SecG